MFNQMVHRQIHFPPNQPSICLYYFSSSLYSLILKSHLIDFELRAVTAVLGQNHTGLTWECAVLANMEMPQLETGMKELGLISKFEQLDLGKKVNIIRRILSMSLETLFTLINPNP